MDTTRNTVPLVSIAVICLGLSPSGAFAQTKQRVAPREADVSTGAVDVDGILLPQPPTGEIVPVPANARIVTHGFPNASSRAAGAPGATDKLIYSNTRGRFIFRPRAGFRISDDISTDAIIDCNITSLKIRVNGGRDGEGEFTVKVSLFDSCPLSGGNPLLDTVCDGGPMVNVACTDDSDCTGGAQCKAVVVYEGLDDDGTLLQDLPLPIPVLPRVLPPSLWIQVEFSTSSAGWVFGSASTRGFSADRYAHPFTGCNTHVGGPPRFPWANFFVEIVADEFCDTHFLAYIAASPSAPTFVAPGGTSTRTADDARLIVTDCELSAIELGMRGTTGAYEMSVDVRTYSPFGPPAAIPNTERVFLGRGVGSVEVQRFLYDENIFPTDASGRMFVTWKPSRGGTGVLQVGRTLIGEGLSTFWLENSPGAPGWEETDMISGRFAILHIAVFCRGDPPVGACCPAQRPGATEIDCFDDVTPIACIIPGCGVAEECQGARWTEGAVCAAGAADPFDPPCGTHACCGPDQRCQGGSNNGALCSSGLDCAGGGICVEGQTGRSCDNVFFDECEALTDLRENERPCAIDRDCPSQRTCQLNGLCEPKKARWSSGEFCGEFGFGCPFFVCVDGVGDCFTSAGDPFEQDPCTSFLQCEPGQRCLIEPGETSGFCELRVGCGSLTCCDAVCSAGQSERFCCVVGWDNPCANVFAVQVCDRAPGIDFCFNRDPDRGAAELIPNDPCVTANNENASADNDDPGFCCHNAGPGLPALGTIWYWFEAIDTSARLHTCDTPGSLTAIDSLIQVFKIQNPNLGRCADDDTVTCSVSLDNCPGGTGMGLCRLDEEAACDAFSDPVTVIGCNDDSPGCGNGTNANSDLCVSGLIPGNRYYVVLASSRGDTLGNYTLCLESPCPITPPDNDNCDEPTPLFDLDKDGVIVTPFDLTGSTLDCPAEEGGTPACEEEDIRAQKNDTWRVYFASCTGNLTVETCGPGAADCNSPENPDTTLAVYRGVACPPGEGDLLGCNDDADIDRACSFSGDPCFTVSDCRAKECSVSGELCLTAGDCTETGETCDTRVGTSLERSCSRSLTACATDDDCSQGVCRDDLETECDISDPMTACPFRFCERDNGVGCASDEDCASVGGVCERWPCVPCPIDAPTCESDTCETAECVSTSCGRASHLSVPVFQGAQYLIRLGGSNGGEPCGNLTLTCTEDDCNNNSIPDVIDIQEGRKQDCNCNNRPDDCDIAALTSADCNNNAVPDECEIDDGSGLPGTCDNPSCSMGNPLNTNCQPDVDENGELDTCDPVDPVSAEPNCDDTLPRTRNNYFVISFSGEITAPVAGEIEIREMLPAGAFGADLSASFTFAVQNGLDLVIQETGDVLNNETWYAILGTSSWVNVNTFQLNYPVVYGDVSNGGDTDVTDVTQVLANRGDPSLVDSRFDINGSGAVDVTDVTITLSNRGSSAPANPGGHVCTLAGP